MPSSVSTKVVQGTRYTVRLGHRIIVVRLSAEFKRWRQISSERTVGKRVLGEYGGMYGSVTSYRLLT